jgi:Uma2 family endonuclease
MLMSLDRKLPDAQPMTVDDLLTLPEDLRYELIDGRLVLRDYPIEHFNLQMDLCKVVEEHAPLDSLVVHSISLAVNHHTELRPDVVVINLDHAFTSPVPVGDVFLAVDVITRSTHFRDLYAKTKIYAAAGVTDYWIIDPWFEDRMELSRFRLGVDGRYEMVDSTRERCITMLPFPVTIDLPVLSAKRQKLLNRIERASGRT